MRGSKAQETRVFRMPSLLLPQAFTSCPCNSQTQRQIILKIRIETRNGIYKYNRFAHISSLSSEPADIFRAALHHRSHYLFILLFRYFIYKFYFSGTDTDQTTILHETSAEDSRHKWILRKNQPKTVSIFTSQSVYNYRSSHATGNSDKIVHIFHLALGWENRQKTD